MTALSQKRKEGKKHGDYSAGRRPGTVTDLAEREHPHLRDLSALLQFERLRCAGANRHGAHSGGVHRKAGAGFSRGAPCAALRWNAVGRDQRHLRLASVGGVQAERSAGNSLAAGPSPPGGRLVSAAGHHLVEAQRHAGEHQKPLYQKPRVHSAAVQILPILL